MSIETRNSIDFWLDQPIDDLSKWQVAFGFYIDKKNEAQKRAQDEADRNRKKGR